MKPERYARVHELFSRVCDLDEQQRNAVLSELPEADADIRQEVESLLAYDSSKTLLRSSDDTVVDYKEQTVLSPVQNSVVKQLRIIGVLTSRLGPRGHLALGAIVACVLLAIVGYVATKAISQYQKALRADALQEILDGKIAGLEMWFEHEQEKVESWARSEKLQVQILRLAELAKSKEDDWEALRESSIQDAIRSELQDLSGQKDVQHAIWDRRSITVSSSAGPQLIGNNVTGWGAAILADVFGGESRMVLYDGGHTISQSVPAENIRAHLGVVTPVYADQGDIVAALLIHDIDARDMAGRILRMVRLGESGESYAFSKEGVMISESRFEDQLREIGLLPANGDTAPILLRDPGGDMTRGYRPDEALASRPLTKMARHAIAGETGVDVDGYRDYRGVPVVGAWRWLDEYEIGIATELDVSENAPGHWIVQLASWFVLSLFAMCLAVAVFSYYSVHKIRSQVGEHQLLGQYALGAQIGAGGMGKVFKAEHAFLKRPLAVKMLRPDLVDKQSIARFEREASITSQLSHPHTIEIFDYGVTPEGIFFFVMEYVEGPTLWELVKQHGPLCPARAVYLLKQICESLREAHSVGIIHRDLKPQNIMLCDRGGLLDFVKVVDFGLVKRQAAQSSTLTAPEVLAGTPQYIAPERLKDPTSASPATDIYSLGAVAYFLLEGRELFENDSLAGLLFQVMNNDVPRLTGVGKTISRDLEEIIMSCLSPDPADRPRDCSEILEQLELISNAERWGQADARQWWHDNG